MSHDFKVTIVSLPQFKMDYASVKKHLFGLLGNARSMTSPASLTGNFCRDILTEDIIDADKPMLHEIPDMCEHAETNPIIILEGHFLSKVTVIIVIFENIDIVQGCISDDNVEKFINSYHPLAKIWFSAIKHQSTAAETIQLQSSIVTEKLARIKRSVMLAQNR